MVHEGAHYCDCGEIQTVRHIVDTCPRTKFVGGIDKLHNAKPETITWLANLVVQL